MLRGWITARPITKYVSTVALAIAFALGLGHATASAQPTVSRLRTGGASGAEGYLFTAGDTGYARGAADAGKYYRFVVTDPGGATRATSACRPSPKGNGGVSNSYVVAATDPVSTATAWRYQLQQFDAAGCAGSPSKTAQLYFGVAKASAYAGSSLTLPKSSFATGATAYVTVAGLTGVKTSPAAGPTADWSAWNLEANFETRPCADFAAANQGAWKLKLKLNNTHFVTLPAFSVDTTPPDTAITGGPAGTTRATSAVFDLSSPETGASFECRLDGGAWTACTSPVSYSGLALGSHTLAVRAIDAAGNAD